MSAFLPVGPADHGDDYDPEWACTHCGGEPDMQECDDPIQSAATPAATASGTRAWHAAGPVSGGTSGFSDLLGPHVFPSPCRAQLVSGRSAEPPLQVTTPGLRADGGSKRKQRSTGGNIVRNRFARACTVLAAGVAVTSVIGLSAASASTIRSKPAATAACGFNCFSLSSLITGPGIIQNSFIPGGNGIAIHAKAGTRLNMKLGNDSYTQEDFTTNTPGLTVSDFCAPPGFPVTGQEFPATSYVCIHLSSDPVFESNWSPDGNESGLCVGVTVANIAGPVVLEPCGVTVKTLWIADEANAHIGATPWINGGDQNFSHPYILTENVGTHSPVNQLFVERENLLTGGFVDDSQMFRVAFGPFV